MDFIDDAPKMKIDDRPDLSVAGRKETVNSITASHTQESSSAAALFSLGDIKRRTGTEFPMCNNEPWKKKQQEAILFLGREIRKNFIRRKKGTRTF